jgi:hypothetical protein
MKEAHMTKPDLKPADHYVGQVIHYGGRRYTITEGPEYEFASLARTRNDRGQEVVLLLRLNADGEIIRASTRHGNWQDVTVTAPVAV